MFDLYLKAPRAIWGFWALWIRFGIPSWGCKSGRVGSGVWTVGFRGLFAGLMPSPRIRHVQTPTINSVLPVLSGTTH